MSENRKCILIIDDEDDVCRIVKTRFEAVGYKVVTANEGAEGFKQTETHKPDIVLVDVRIPCGEDGLTYLRKLRSYRHDNIDLQTKIRKTPVIILTGFGATMQSLFEMEGISGYIEKPFDLVNLQSKIEGVLKLR
ncbi:MAG: Alkaline phosphatase synthesis transcriptional regulatory protein PhoP [Candidatus Omnitrophica bacterium ADurb.Bin314]|nr:MAG: Alkaline phosphatase synthesis transcriptional regulatory protein PhoP [Candidatus Omnitrophica bacterium ADurb.Bin314]HOE68414.1 response regulator [Candidatus Omnitrophota bacterium]